MVSYRQRIYCLATLFCLITALLAGRLIYLQLVAGPRLAARGLEGRVQEVPVGVDRGEILDRNGTPLTNTAQHFSVVVFPAQIGDKWRTIRELEALTGIDAEKIAAAAGPVSWSSSSRPRSRAAKRTSVFL